jgi:MATE family multidrug resistance protein
MAPEHPFHQRPHRTLLALGLPVLGSLVAEPLTGLVDTAFVARLGAEELAALGVGTIVLSASLWIFNFLGVGTQTAVAQALGRGDREAAASTTAHALGLAFACGLGVALLGWLAAVPVSRLMGAEGAITALAAEYVRIRGLGAPAVLVTVAAFGALRGREDMTTPLWVAVGVNLLNALLDGPLVFGWGPAPALGVAGAAWASTVAQWLGAGWAVRAALVRLGRPGALAWAEVGSLVRVGGALFVRTGLLTLFLLLATRAATQAGAEAGAAHQAIRQVWAFTALFLDAFAVTGQSLVAGFVGGGVLVAARRAARVVLGWSAGVGLALALALWLATPLVEALLVPESARAVFRAAWLASLVFLPLNGLTFGTDGVHWGTGDFRYLAVAVAAATGLGAAGLAFVDPSAPGALALIWWITGGWIVVRALFGLVRIWPGIGRAPLAG